MLATDATSHPKQPTTSLFLALDERAATVVILWIGFALRLTSVDRFAFHPDEAIYSFWALHGRYVDPLFLHIWPDKPPLFLWVLQGAFDLLGTTPIAARTPNILFSTLSIAVVVALARHWWGTRAGLIAGLLMALNPFAISFAATAFTDPLLVLAGLLAIHGATRRHPLWSGVWLGVAAMTKQQGLLFAPMVLALLFQPPLTLRQSVRYTLRLLAGLLLVAAPIFYWDSLRWAVAPSPWDLGARNATGFALSDPAAWLARLLDWMTLSRHLLGDPLPWLLLLAAMLAPLRRRGAYGSGPALWPAIVLAGWGAGFLIIHTISTAQIWDRYLLPLAPVVALLGGFCATWSLQRCADQQTAPECTFTQGAIAWLRIHANRAFVSMLLLAAWLLLLAGPAVQAAQGTLAIGGDHGAYTGIDDVAAWLVERSESQPVVYHRTLGWHLQFHLFAPLQDGQIDLRWAPSAVQLADNAAKTPHRLRYLVEADWSPARDLSLHLAARNLIAEPRLRIGRFTIYAIHETTAHPNRTAQWRVCRASVSPNAGWNTWQGIPDSTTLRCTNAQQGALP
jgi:4-amino-4-deoxy-L-arabinose transferase-like glycosyltransferase